MPHSITLQPGSTPWTPVSPSYYVAPSLGVAYLQIPKAGCSSILSWMLLHENPVKYAEIAMSLAKSPFALHHSGKLLAKVNDPGALLRFTFVRHPFSRVLSFYRNQVSPHASVSDPVEKAVTDNEIASSGYTPGMLFEDFLGAVLGGGRPLMDPHVRPQVDSVLGKRGLNVDFLGKLEELHLHHAFLQKNLRVEPEKLPKINRTNAAHAHRALLEPKHVDALAQLYAEDLKLLNYSKDQF